jgi:mRNA interferase MazF
VYWVEAASGDVTPNYRHPHVVIQDDVLNQSRLPTVVVCAISSNLARANEPGNVRLDDGEANLPRPSVVIVSQLSSLPKAQLGQHIGTLSEGRVEQIYDGLRFQQRAHFRGR